MKTVIGLFEAKDEAMRAYAQLLVEGYARADVDILTNDDRDDEPKLARMHSWVPKPDVDIYLAGVRDGGTIVTANVGDTAVARAASILGSFNMVNISRRASQLAAKVALTAATGTGRGARGRGGHGDGRHESEPDAVRQRRRGAEADAGEGQRATQGDRRSRTPPRTTTCSRSSKRTWPSARSRLNAAGCGSTTSSPSGR